MTKQFIAGSLQSWIFITNLDLVLLNPCWPNGLMDFVGFQRDAISDVEHCQFKLFHPFIHELKSAQWTRLKILWLHTALVSVIFSLQYYLICFVFFFIFYCSSLSWPPLLSVFTSWSWQIFSNRCILGTAVMTAVYLYPTSCPDRKSARCLCSSVWPSLLPLLL